MSKDILITDNTELNRLRAEAKANEDRGKFGWAVQDDPLPPALPLTLKDWLGRKIAPADKLLGPFSTTSRTLFSAPSGSGKTMVGLDLALHMAAGRDFLHWKAHRPARVLYLDAEMAACDMQERLRMAVDRLGEWPAGFHLVSHEDLPDGLPPLDTAAGQDLVDAVIERLGAIDFLVVDNLQAVTSSSLKDTEYWQAMSPWVRELSARRIGFLLFHHTSADGDRGYGDRSKEWPLTSVIVGKPDVDADADVALRLSFTKARNRTQATRHEYEPIVARLANNAWSFIADGKSTVATTSEERVPADADRAFEQLLAAIGDEGVALPAGHDFPAGVRGVKEEVWRQRYLKAYRRPPTEDTAAGRERESDRLRKSYSRAVERLLKDHKVRRYDNYVWPMQEAPDEELTFSLDYDRSEGEYFGR